MRRKTKYATVTADKEHENQKSKQKAIAQYEASHRVAEDVENYEGDVGCIRMRTEVTEHDDEGMTGCETVKHYVALQVDGEPQGVEYLRDKKEKHEQHLGDEELGTEFYVETDEGDVPLEEYNGGEQ